MKFRLTSALAAPAVVLTAVLSLSGCSGDGAMSTDDAAAYYLENVCPGIPLRADFADAFKSLDMARLVPAATAFRDQREANAEAFADPDHVWPEAVADDIVIIHDNLVAQVDGLTEVAAAPSVTDAAVVPLPDGTAAGEAGARVREALGLSADLSECAAS
ncbi:hypothetical protein ACFSBZ_04645 [Amnibacterium flavum]|uniref:Lipoprotein n=1 Tax=Amnibacterium flavum TaxID=2173173 RepID=A0A2V1HNU1_9MICO|nr:hypothetical protein [Amnibacterium flavum]PVZ94228.1 hypothetical protein DDQ50_10825 [Amnibacterium flavum]